MEFINQSSVNAFLQNYTVVNENLYQGNYTAGIWYSLYSTCSFFCNGFTIFMWFTWITYILFRTCSYELGKVVCSKKTWEEGGLKKVAECCNWDSTREKWKNFIRIGCYRLDEILIDSDHTCTRNRSIRLFCCFHLTSVTLSFGLFLSQWYEKVKWLCLLQMIIIQMSVFTMSFILPLIYIWYITADFCMNRDLLLLGCFRCFFSRKFEISQRFHITTNTTEPITPIDSSLKLNLDDSFSMNFDSINPPTSSLKTEVRHVRKREVSFVEKILFMTVEVICYILIIGGATVSVLVVLFGADQYKTLLKAKNWDGNWCWIDGFGLQVSSFYGWLWLDQILLVVFVLIFSLWLCCTRRCKKKRVALCKLTGYIVLLYVFWGPSTFHRVYVGIANQDHQIFGLVQEVTAALYGGANIVQFYMFLCFKIMCQKDRKTERRGRRSISGDEKSEEETKEDDGEEKFLDIDDITLIEEEKNEGSEMPDETTFLLCEGEEKSEVI